jgi:uncharacterized protein YcaQ
MALTSAEKVRAYRERQRLERLAEIEAAMEHGETREQGLRDYYGFGASETRTERERSDTAARILKRDPETYWQARHPEPVTA